MRRGSDSVVDILGSGCYYLPCEICALVRTIVVLETRWPHAPRSALYTQALGLQCTRTQNALGVILPAPDSGRGGAPPLQLGVTALN